jgi:phosphoserine phosphatase
MEYTILGSPIQLVAFDLDGTLTKVESTWQYVHDKLGTWNTGKLTAEDYWKGRIDYVRWAQLDSYMWRGVKLEKIKAIVDEIPYVEGAKEAIASLKRKRKTIGIVSAGISLLCDKVSIDLGMDFSVANELHVSQDRITGDVTVNVSLNDKGRVIEEAAKQFGFSLRECAVVGDTRYDLPSGTGLRIAFNSRDPQIKKTCDVLVRGSDLRAILTHIP